MKEAGRLTGYPTMNTTPPLPKARFLLFLMFAVVAMLGLRTISNSDFWIHLATGRALAESGWIKADPFSFATNVNTTWVNPTWLYDAISFRLWQLGGAIATGLVSVASLLLALYLLLPIARSRASGAATAFALLLVAWLMAPALSVGPHIAALLAIAITIRVLTTATTRGALLALIPLQILWTNTHGSFLLCPILAALFCVESAKSENRKRLAAWVPFVLLAATLVNPYGIQLHSLAIKGAMNPNSVALMDWISPFQGDFALTLSRHINTVLLVVVLAGFVSIRGRLPLAVTTLGVLGAFLIVASPRYLLFGGLFIFPFAALSLQGVGAWLNARTSSTGWASLGRGLLAVAGLASVLLVVSNFYYNRSGSASTFGLGVASDLFPENAAASFLNRPDFPERAINLPNDGGYLAWRLPKRKIFSDNRASVYGGAAFYQELNRALFGQAEEGRAFFDRYDPGAIVLNGVWPHVAQAARRLLETDQWGLAYWDGSTIVLIRQTPEYARLLLDSNAQSAGLKALNEAQQAYAQQLSSALPARNQSRLIAAATFLMSLQRYSEAQPFLEAVTRGSPTYATAWHELGLCHGQAGRLDESVSALRRATELRPNSVTSWLWLERSLRLKGETALADQAREKAHNLNDAFASAFERSMEKAAPAAQ